jgi:hypothetical protein
MASCFFPSACVTLAVLMVRASHARISVPGRELSPPEASQGFQFMLNDSLTLHG